jgi:putative phosphoribosyl transferase
MYMSATVDTGERSVGIPVDSIVLPGDLTVPPTATSLVIFAHGSGSGRKSPRNRFVASMLQNSSIATLLFDLLTPEEDSGFEMRFDIELLTRRLEAVTLWARARAELSTLPIGCFGASTGAAAALGAAADLPEWIQAVVSRGGRPDLTARDLGLVKAPTLLVVGGFDDVVIQLNERAFSAMKTKKEFHIVRGASHLFEEPGVLEELARVVSNWFRLHLSRSEE